MSFERISCRLSRGRPLVLDADIGASFRARGVELDVPGALGMLLRERPAEVQAHHAAEVASKVDVLSALTVDTTPRALAEVGMQYRSAQLTGRALDLALEIASGASKLTAVAGLLGSDMVGPVAADRLHEELVEHAARLRVSGSELVIARGQGSRVGLMAAVVAAAQTELPTWAVLECGPRSELQNASLGEVFDSLREAGTSVVLFEATSVEVALQALERAEVALEWSGLIPGVLLAASDQALRGFADPTSEPEKWAARALNLSRAGARVLGGGAGTTEAHTRALALALGSLHPSTAARRPDAGLNRDPSGW